MAATETHRASETVFRIERAIRLTTPGAHVVLSACALAAMVPFWL